MTVVNQEETSLGDCYRFIRRQMVCLRLYPHAWRHVVANSLSLLLSGPLAAVCLISWALGEGVVAWVALVVLALGVPATGGGLVCIGWRVWAAAPPDRPMGKLKPEMLLCIPLVLVIQIGATLAAWRTREIDWRGIHYDIRRDGGCSLTLLRAVSGHGTRNRRPAVHRVTMGD